MKRILFLLTISLLSLNAQAQQEKLIFAVDLIRHGDRTPTHSIPTSPYEWPQGLGQLTAKGMEQEYARGKEFHQRYIEETHLLPEHYQAETLRVRSTDFDRTLMSAECALLGLYPLGTGPSTLPASFQPIPIHTTELKQDQLLAHDERSPEFKEILKNTVFTRSDWKQKTAELQPNFAHWSKVTGMPIKNLIQLIILGDILSVRNLYKAPLPEGLSESDVNTIIEAGRWVFTTIYQSKEVGTFTGHPLLAEISKQLEKAAHHPDKLKYLLFSAHDSTILSLMSVMQVPMDSPPPYASDLNIALYELGPNNYSVSVRLNGKTVALPGCSESACSLEQFEALV